MCGIVGYIGKNPEETIVNKLKQLEYRGYDSSGVAVKSAEKITIFKSQGEIVNLVNKIKTDKANFMGIGHTRWATHGKPTENNAHPHVSNDNNIVLCHNGVIENYSEIKSFLIKKGFTFYSETDTECVVNLLQYNYKNDFLLSLKKTCEQLKGSFSLVIMNNSENKIYFAKNKSPLYVSKNGQSTFIASDVICFYKISTEYFEIADGWFGYIDKDSFAVFDKTGKINPSSSTLTISDYVGENKFEHYMLKEIHDTKNSLKNLVEYYENYFSDGLEKVSFLRKYKKIKFVGCGTAYHACLIGSALIEKIAHIESKCYVGSEFRYCNPIIDKDTLIILISQSGETADTLGSLWQAKQRGGGTLAIVNVEHSTLAKNCDYVFPIKAGVEIAVASTKAFSAQVLTIYILSLALNCLQNNTKIDFSDVNQFIKDLNYGTYNNLTDVANILKNSDKLFMIGRGIDYYIALESSLKIKETSYINTDTYYAGELKHGFLALIEDESFLIVFATDENVLSKTLTNAEEAKARGAKMILFTSLCLEDKIKEKFFYTYKVNKVHQDLQCIQNIIIWQEIAYYISKFKNINPDKPRNLAKSVTVE